MNRILPGVLLAFALTCSAGAREGQPIAVALAVDSGAVVRIGDNGTGVAALDGEKLAPPTPWVRSAVRHITSGKLDWAMGENSATLPGDATGVAADPIIPGEIHIAFRQIGDSEQRLLVISNGYDRAFVYRAQIRVDGKDQYTDVCTIPPHMHGLEHWAYASDRILLADLRLEEWPEGTPPRCE